MKLHDLQTFMSLEIIHPESSQLLVDHTNAFPPRGSNPRYDVHGVVIYTTRLSMQQATKGKKLAIY